MITARYFDQQKVLDENFESLESQLKSFPLTSLPKQEYKQYSIKRDLHHVCVVGLGGSSLGTKTLVDALRIPSISFLDNVDPEFVETTVSKLPKDNTLFIFVSKSGETLEVLELFYYLLANHIQPRNCIILCDPIESTLAKLSREYGIEKIDSPLDVPGRFSVLSNVGLVPIGLHSPTLPSQILKGAKAVRIKDAYELAYHQFLHDSLGRRINVIFPYCDRLSSFADWYIQLLAESIGKTSKIGLTPLKAVGVKDQHAQLQLFLDGPDDKFYIFIKPEKLSSSDEVSRLESLFTAEYDGVIGAFEKRKKPFATLTVPELNAESIGELLYFFEMSVSFLGLLFKIDFCNQPAVELSKQITAEKIAPSTCVNKISCC